MSQTSLRSPGGGSPSEPATCRERLRASYRAVPGSVAAVRQAVGKVAIESGATVEQVDAIRLAASEAMTNAVVHGYADGPGKVHVRAAVGASELWVLVCDDGTGLRPRSEHSGLGLGLGLIAHACDELAIVKRSSGGTEVRMRFRLGDGLSGGVAVEQVASAAA